MLTKERERERVKQTPFIRLLKSYMLDHDLEGPTELNNFLLDEGVIDPGDGKGHYGAIHSYLAGNHVPQAWFVRAVLDTLPETEEQANELMRAYFESYG